MKPLKQGGDIGKRTIFSHIQSIGFEIETTDLIKITLVKNKDKDIFINSEIYNFQLELNHLFENEYMYIINEPDIKFKITNDTAETSKFNSYLKDIYENKEDDQSENKIGGENNNKKTEDVETDEADETDESDETDDDSNDDEDDEDEDDDDESDYKEEEEEEDDEVLPNPIYSLQIPENPYLKKPKYDLFLKRGFDTYSGFDIDEESGELAIYPLTDTEYICTFYNPKKSSNVIKTYLSEMIHILYGHLLQLQTIHDSKLKMLTANKEEKTVSHLPNQLYVLPNTNLGYYNSSIYDTSSYDITKDLSVVLQMTFGVNIKYLYRTIKQLLHLESSLNKGNREAFNFMKEHKEDEQVNTLIDLIKEYRKGHTLDVFWIDFAFNTVKKLINTYKNSNPQYVFSSAEKVAEVQSYLFIIFYQLVVYLNSYIENKSPLKFHLSFVFRHKNLMVYNEIKKTIKELIALQVEAEGKSQEEIDEIANDILIKIIDNPRVLKTLYYTKFIAIARKAYVTDVDENTLLSGITNPVYANHIGNPLYSIVSYFEHFKKNKDFIQFSYTDSTSFNIENGTIIVEFRDFPTYLYLELFMTSNNKMRSDIIKNKVGTLTIGTLMEYISLNESTISRGVSKKRSKSKNKTHKKHRKNSKRKTR